MTEPRHRTARHLQPRTLYVRGTSEPRLSRVDEQHIADTARLSNTELLTAEVLQSLNRIYGELDAIERNLGQIASGNHRDAIRFARRGINSIAKTLR